jgi:hypothetical protein
LAWEWKVHPLPKPVDASLSEVVVDRLPRREVPRQHAPLAAALEHVEGGVEDLVGLSVGFPR